MNNYSYIGTELELFSKAYNWKAYCRSLIQSYLQRTVLEIGAGLGGTTEFLCKGDHAIWFCLEPDPALASQIKYLIEGRQLPSCCEVRVGTLADIGPTERFETIIYIDVLEHIKTDRHEVTLASQHLKPGGTLVVLSPAHQWLFTPFDKAIGHYRRYTKKTLSAIIPDDLECLTLLYLDSVGLIASLGNRFILKSKAPTLKQIQLWDRAMVPLSRKLDPLLRYSIGKSILGIWQKKA
jgi:hypothetical protein